MDTMLASDTACNFLNMSGMIKIPDLKSCQSLFHSQDEALGTEKDTGETNMEKETLDKMKDIKNEANASETETASSTENSGPSGSTENSDASSSTKLSRPTELGDHLGPFNSTENSEPSTSTENSRHLSSFDYSEPSVSMKQSEPSSDKNTDSKVEELEENDTKSIENGKGDDSCYSIDNNKACGENVTVGDCVKWDLNGEVKNICESSTKSENDSKSVNSDIEENCRSNTLNEQEESGIESSSKSYENINLHENTSKQIVKKINESDEVVPNSPQELAKLDRPDSDSELENQKKCELTSRNITHSVEYNEHNNSNYMTPSRKELNENNVCQMSNSTNSNKNNEKYSRPWESSDKNQDRKVCLDFLPESCRRLPVSKVKSLTYKYQDVMQFAEILYKCTLCTSIPSILTSRQSFIDHMQRNHLEMGKHYHSCPHCSLLFQTVEDLRHHQQTYFQTGSPSNESCDQTGSDIIKSCDYDMESSNDSDSDSSGHRQFRTKLVKKFKPVYDFQNPKQLVDHTGIETSNGSLDLTKKTSSLENTYSKIASHSPCKKEPCEFDIKTITDQIVKCDVQCLRQSTESGSKLPFSPGYTAEFGKYTKLVREGGNIVYFCQICNWKSPIKSTFQTHCNLASHKSKVLNAGHDGHKVDTKSDMAASVKLSSLSLSDFIENKSVPDYNQKCSNENLFYKYIVHSGNESHNKMGLKTPVVSMYGNHKAKIFAGSHYTNKRTSNWSSEIQSKRRKRAHERAYNRQDYSDSDDDNDECDDDIGDETGGHKNGIKPSYKALLRSKLMENVYRNCSPRLPSNKTSSHVFPSLTSQCGTKNESLKDGDIVNNCSNRNGFSPNLYKCRTCSCGFTDNEDYQRHIATAHKSVLSSILLAENPNTTSQVTVMEPRTSQMPGSHDAKNSGSQLFEEYGASTYKHYSGAQQFNESGSQKHSETGSLKLNDGGSLHFKESGSRLDGNGSGTYEGKEASDFGKSSDGATESGEQWRVQKLKELLPNYVTECKRGNVSRDRLLQCIGSRTEYTDAMLWSSACNKVVREIFPRSLAQRKGRYKKTYYFGITMLETYQTPDDISSPDSDWLFLGSPQDSQALQLPSREVTVEPGRIVEQLPAIVKWTGCMEEGVYRQDLLSVLALYLCDQDASHWGAQCNRAMRHVFPLVDMKRKGKYKSTMFMGVQFQAPAQRILSSRLDCLQRFDHYTYQTPSPNYQLTDHNLPECTRKPSLFPDLSERSNSPIYTHTYNRNEAPHIKSETSLSYSFSESIRRDAENEMDEYLMKFGGLSSRDSNSGSPLSKGSELEQKKEVTKRSFDSRETILDNLNSELLTQGKITFSQESQEKKLSNKRNYDTMVSAGVSEPSEDIHVDEDTKSDELENEENSAGSSYLKDTKSEKFENRYDLHVKDRSDLKCDAFDETEVSKPCKLESLFHKTDRVSGTFSYHLEQECTKEYIQEPETKLDFNHSKEVLSETEEKSKTLEMSKEIKVEVLDDNEKGVYKEETDKVYNCVETDSLKKNYPKCEDHPAENVDDIENMKVEESQN